MNRLLECDGETAWVEAGITWHQVSEALRPRGLDYTSAPLNMLSTVGGTLGVGGIDVNSPRHGCSADQAVELEVVTPTGDIVRVKEGDEYLERVLLGYGQFGVITKARIKVRPYRPMTVRHFPLHRRRRRARGHDAPRRAGRRGRVRHPHAARRRDRADRRLRDGPKDFAAAQHARAARLREDRRRARAASVAVGEIGFLMRRKNDLLPALHDPLFVRDGSRPRSHRGLQPLIWRYWGGRRSSSRISRSRRRTSSAAPARHRGLQAYFPYFTLYAVMIRKFGDRPRYEMSAIPATGDDHVCGIEFSPLLEGASYSRDHFQRFKNAIYDIGLELGGSYYRFGGVMKPYVRRMFGDEMVDRHRAMKQALDPAFILNRDVVFDRPEAG
jgi:FAD/FMN-containing dehydrogenase